MKFIYCPRCAASMMQREVIEEGCPIPRATCSDEACGFIHYENPTPAVGVLIEHEGDILLARGTDWPEGFFALITGYLEKNEEPTHAVTREVKEETNLDVIACEVIGNYIFTRKNEVMLCYFAKCKGTIILSPELAEVRRYQPHELRPWPRATGFAIADWMRQQGLPVQFIDRPPVAAKPTEDAR